MLTSGKFSLVPLPAPFVPWEGTLNRSLQKEVSLIHFFVVFSAPRDRPPIWMTVASSQSRLVHHACMHACQQVSQFDSHSWMQIVALQWQLTRQLPCIPW